MRRYTKDAEYPTAGSVVTNRAVLVGAYVYLFALGGGGGGGGALSNAGSIWKYKLWSHVAADGATGVDSTAVGSNGGAAHVKTH